LPAKISKSIGPLAVNHSGQLPSVTISFNTKPGCSLSQAVSDVTAASRATLPSTVDLSIYAFVGIIMHASSDSGRS
jgi:HAE1 family hydrophobic/amphiphilic exporter-1